MRILFVHQNFPGQYLKVVPALVEHGHEVRAITRHDNQRPITVPVDRYEIGPLQVPGLNPLAGHFHDHVRRGEVVASLASRMRAGGYQPDVICGHLGWGETLFLKEIWPAARMLVHAEFFYGTSGGDVGFDRAIYPIDLAGLMRARSRQAALLLAINAADMGQAPTQWQRQAFPAEIRPKIRVVHEGIDTDVCAPSPSTVIRLKNGSIVLKPGDEVITFVNRNLEPYRGYHIFMRALPKVLKARPKARAIIVGGNEVSYGGPPPADPATGNRTSWREIFFNEVRDKLDTERVHFVGRIPYDTFVQLMQVSAVHPYLTYPFVLSWSMLEAMSAGALVIGSRTAPVEEVITDGETGRLVDFFDPDAWSEAIIEALAEPQRFRAMREAGRKLVVERYDLKTVCLPQQVSLVEQLGR